MALNNDIHDRILSHAVDLERFKADQRNRALRSLKQLEQDLVEQLAKADLPGYTLTAYKTARLKALLTQTRATIQSAYTALRSDLTSDWSKLAQNEAEFARQAVNRSIGVEIATAAVSSDMLKSIISDLAIEGGPSAEWWTRQAAFTQQQFADTVRQGMLRGDTTAEISKAVRDNVMTTSARNSEALVRTSVATVAQDARLASFAENADVIDAIQQHSTLDARTTDICKKYSGATYSNDGDHTPLDGSPPYLDGIPRHWNCRSYWVPVVKSLAQLADVETDQGTVDEVFRDNLAAQGFDESQVEGAMLNAQASMDGQVADTLTYEDWLRTKPIEFQRDVLGPTKYRLWSQGKISFADLVDESGRPMTVEELLAQTHEQPGLFPNQKAEGTMSFELSFGEGSPYAKKFPSLYDLPFKTSEAITKQVMDKVTDIAIKESGAKGIDVIYGPGGYKNFPVQPSGQATVRGTPKQIKKAMDIIGYLAQQTEVYGIRPNPNGLTTAILLKAPTQQLADPEVAQAFWKRLVEESPKIAQGFSPVEDKLYSGIRIIIAEGEAPTAAEFGQFAKAVRKVASEFNMADLDIYESRVDLLKTGTNWMEDPNGTSYIQRLTATGRPGIQERLVNKYRPAVENEITQAFKNYTEGHPLTQEAVSLAPPAPPESARTYFEVSTAPDRAHQVYDVRSWLRTKGQTYYTFLTDSDLVGTTLRDETLLRHGDGLKAYLNEQVPGSFDALSNYKASGFSTINAVLREQVDSIYTNARLPKSLGIPQSLFSQEEINAELAKVRDKISAIDRTLAQHPTREDMIVWREITPAEFEEPTITKAEDIAKHVGENFDQQGYMSTSVTQPTGANLQIKLRVPAGTPSYYMDLIKDMDEKEMLLPHGYSYRIIKVTSGPNPIFKKNITWTVEAELVPPARLTEAAVSPLKSTVIPTKGSKLLASLQEAAGETPLPQGITQAVEILDSAGLPESLHEPGLMKLQIKPMSQSYAGLYEADLNTITIDPKYQNEAQVFLHEYGHYLDFQHIGAEQRLGMVEEQKALSQAFRTDIAELGGSLNNEQYDALRVKLLERVPSEYAMQNDVEWFAESFKDYVSSPVSRERLARIAPKTFKLIEQLMSGQLPEGERLATGKHYLTSPNGLIAATAEIKVEGERVILGELVEKETLTQHAGKQFFENIISQALSSGYTTIETSNQQGEGTVEQWKQLAEFADIPFVEIKGTPKLVIDLHKISEKRREELMLLGRTRL